LLWIVGVTLVAATILMAGWIVLSRPRPFSGPHFLELEAEKARLAILEGAGLTDVILQCYLQMSLALKQEQGIERETYMTTGEFERFLEAEGFPHDPIHQLTRLFEAVRYGHWQPGLTEKQNAIDCLEAIINYSRERRQAG